MFTARSVRLSRGNTYSAGLGELSNSAQAASARATGCHGLPRTRTIILRPINSSRCRSDRAWPNRGCWPVSESAGELLRISMSISLPLDSATARATVFSNCLTFPGHSSSQSASINDGKPSSAYRSAAQRALASERWEILAMASQQGNSQLDHGKPIVDVHSEVPHLVSEARSRLEQATMRTLTRSIRPLLRTAEQLGRISGICQLDSRLAHRNYKPAAVLRTGLQGAVRRTEVRCRNHTCLPSRATSA